MNAFSKLAVRKQEEDGGIKKAPAKQAPGKAQRKGLKQESSDDDEEEDSEEEKVLFHG